MKNFLYLVQGQSELVKNYLHLADRDSADAVFLTYDKPIEEALYFPNSTWAQGRNKMLEIALTKEDYLYYIFCDDDITWWASCEIQQILIQNFYFADSIQFNKIYISNECRLRYPNSDAGINMFEKHIRDWLAKQFIGSYKDISKSVKRNLLIILWRTFSFFIRRHHYLRTSSYSVSESSIKNALSNNSEILKKYLEHLKNCSND